MTAIIPHNTMSHKNFIVVFAIIVGMSFPASAMAQQGSSSSSGLMSGSSGLSESSAPSLGLQTFDEVGNTSLVGVSGNSAFIGVDSYFESGSLGSRRTNTASTSTRRTTTSMARRSSVSRSMMGNRSNTSEIRSSATVAIDGVAMERTPQLSTPVARQFADKINVTFQNEPSGTTATMTGTVTNEHQSRVARQLLLLEPGIYKVNNELKVGK